MTLSTIERVFLLQGAELFKHVPVQELVGIAQLCREVSFNCGERFIEMGTDGDCLYIIASGEVSVVVEGHGQIGTNKQGDVIGEMAIISDRPRAASCVALTDITALAIYHDDFWALMEENPAVTTSVLKVIVQRHEETLLKLRSLPKRDLAEIIEV
jgi:voltage-gated potassium channel